MRRLFSTTKHFTVLAPAANTTNIDFFYCSQFTTNNDHLDNGHKEQNSRQPETRIMKGELLTIVKSSRSSFYQSFSSLFTNYLEVYLRRYMLLRKRRSCECRHCRCLARMAIALSRRSTFEKIQYTKHPKHPSLLNKPLQTVCSSWFSRSHFLDACIMFVSHQFTPGYTSVSYSLRLSQSGICGRQRPQK